jgi:cell division protein FtsL
VIGRVINVVLLLAMVAAAVVTYSLKHEAERSASRVARLHAAIARERAQIALLKAEWSALSQPSRLQQLVERYQDHFQLEPFSVSQVATLDEIPLRPAAPEAAPGEAKVADAGIASVILGNSN